MMRRAAILAAALLPGFATVLSPDWANAMCTDPPGAGVNWQRCNFDGLELAAVDLSGARLRDASFFRADLSGSTMTDIRSSRAKFVNAVLKEAVLDGAKLSEASSVGADLRLARLFRATLRGADLTNARLGGADLNRADLSGATWTDGTRICAEGSIGRCN